MVLIIICVGMASFGLGMLAHTPLQDSPVIIDKSALGAVYEASEVATDKTPATSVSEPGTKQFVASKSGTRYHYPWCPSASQIKEENKIWFSTKEEAERAGYSPAKNCPGL